MTKEEAAQILAQRMHEDLRSRCHTPNLAEIEELMLETLHQITDSFFLDFPAPVNAKMRFWAFRNPLGDRDWEQVDIMIEEAQKDKK